MYFPKLTLVQVLLFNVYEYMWIILINVRFSSFCDFVSTTEVDRCIYIFQDGWWVGISGEAKYPSGQIVHISAEQGRYLARSYSPWYGR